MSECHLEANGKFLKNSFSRPRIPYVISAKAAQPGNRSTAGRGPRSLSLPLSQDRFPGRNLARATAGSWGQSSLPWGGELGGTRRPPPSPPLHAPSVLPASPLAPLGMASPSSGNLSTVRPVLQNTHHSLELVIGLQGVQITPFLTQLTLEPLLSGQPLCGLMQLTCGPIHAPKEPQPLVPIPFSVPAACVQYHPNWMRGHKEMPQGVTWVPTLLFP